jgi:hypothetical protein
VPFELGGIMTILIPIEIAPHIIEIAPHITDADTDHQNKKGNKLGK